MSAPKIQKLDHFQARRLGGSAAVRNAAPRGRGASLARMRLWMAGVERNIATITANASGDLSIPLNKTLAGCRALPLPGLASQSFVAGLDALVLDEDWRLAQLSIDNKVIRGSALS